MARSRRSSSKRKSGSKKMPKGGIKKAIKRPGRLTRAVGGPPSKNMAKVNQLAKRGDSLGQAARLYKHVLRPAHQRRRRGR